MARGSKASYSSKQKRQAEHIEEGYEKRGTSKGEAERQAWATVNKETGGGKKSGSGSGKKVSTASSKKGGKIGGKNSHGGTKKTAAKSKSAVAPSRKAKPGPKKVSTRKRTAKKSTAKRSTSGTAKRKVGRPKKK